MASRQDKATMEKNARTLRELVKMPANKFCADCKRNDARWASWNIGVFICIRCSGIHRSMGTHISKVKSVDLDVWTPEQMASVQKWGNTRANLYWEAHLKPGHQPPEHKMESFIRSKYESRRWAMEGPPPSDPSTLEADNPTDDAAPAASTQTPASPPRASISSQRSNNVAPAVTTIISPPAGKSSATTHNLLSSSHAHSSSLSAPAAPTPAPATTVAPAAPQNELFSLDFSAPAAPQAQAAPKKDMKQDILSLFSSAPVNPVPVAASAAIPAQGVWGQPAAAAPSVWGQPMAAPSASLWGQPVQPAQPTQSMVGTGGPALWGADSWGQPSAAAPPIAGGNVWATAPTQFNTSIPSQDVWGSATSSQPASSGAGAHQTSTKQSDAFGDLWGAFK